MVLIWVAFGAFLGGALSSFLAVVAERVPRGETLSGRSRCVCGRQLSAWENIPVLGWLRSGGKSKCCRSKIPTHYVTCEAVCAVFGAAFGWSVVTGEQLWLATFAFAASLAGCFLYQWRLNTKKT